MNLHNKKIFDILTEYKIKNIDSVLEPGEYILKVGKRKFAKIKVD